MVQILTTYQSQLFTTLGKKPFKNIPRKEENAGNQHFHPFPQCLLLLEEKILLFRPFSI